jgi:hypothetical protein
MNSSRRAFLRNLGFTTAGLLVAPLIKLQSVFAAKIDKKHALYTILKFSEKASKEQTKKKEICGECMHYKPVKPKDAWAPCVIYGNAEVPAAGYCTSFARKPQA